MNSIRNEADLQQASKFLFHEIRSCHSVRDCDALLATISTTLRTKADVTAQLVSIFQCHALPMVPSALSQLHYTFTLALRKYHSDTKAASASTDSQSNALPIGSISNSIGNSKSSCNNECNKLKDSNCIQKRAQKKETIARNKVEKDKVDKDKADQDKDIAGIRKSDLKRKRCRNIGSSHTNSKGSIEADRIGGEIEKNQEKFGWKTQGIQDTQVNQQKQVQLQNQKQNSTQQSSSLMVEELNYSSNKSLKI